MTDTPALDKLRTLGAPQAADSDLIVVAINRLQRAVTKLQAHEYDDELAEHLEKAAEFLGWVATNIWMREPDAESSDEAAESADGGEA